jgi:serine/alanine adding enzyme
MVNVVDAPASAVPVNRAAVDLRPVSIELARSGDEWDRFVHTCPDGTPDHLWGWRAVFAGVMGQQCEYLIARRGDQVVGALPLVLFRSLLFGRFGVSVPFLNYGGILAQDAKVADALIERAADLARTFGGSHLELRHQSRMLPATPSREHKVRMLLDLPSSSEQLWTRIDRKVRNQIRKAQKESLSVQSGGEELLEEFYSVFAQNMRDLGTPVHSKRFFRSVIANLPGRVRVHLVRHGVQPAAASMTIRFREIVLVPWASSLRELRSLCPNMLLYWHMLEHSIQEGAVGFDFGRSSKGAGTHQFKLQWGAREIPLYWEYRLFTRREAPDQGTSNPRLAAAIAAWRRMPLRVTTILGPRIISNIP